MTSAGQQHRDAAGGAARIRRDPIWARMASVFLTLGLCHCLPIERTAFAAGPVIAAIDRIEDEGVRRALFALASPTTVRVVGEGVADPKGAVFLARGWILNLDTRETAWKMDQDHGSFHGKSENWRVDETVELPAGRYALYFSAVSGMVPLDKLIKILGIPLGQVEATIGPKVPWNKLGEPDRWGIRVEAKDAAFQPITAPLDDPGPDPDALVRIFGLRDNEEREVSLELSRPVEFRVRFTGEYDRGVRSFADGAWIRDMSDWREVWAPDDELTRPAGGDFKNQIFVGTVRLSAGRYLLSMAMDGSHAPGAWNAPPPYDPEAWGISLDPVDPADRGAVKVAQGAALPEPLLAISRMRDNRFERIPFGVARDVRVLVRGTGEATRKGQFVDGGWIEQLSDLEPVWQMGGAESLPAGGDAKNRQVQALVELRPGGYALCYATDDSHSYESWNADPPRDPEAWGISLTLLHPDDARAIREGEPKDAPMTIAITRVGNDAELVRRFRLTGKTRFHLVALGEGNDDPLADLGWLENAKNGETIWKMRYGDSQHAGGSSKNRIVRADVSLPRGEYELHYRTDDSHAFGAWNADPPLQPHLWGVMLIEAK